MNRSQLHWRAFHLPKRGNSAAEFEDAFAGDPRSGRFAIADGASESAFAGLWAKLLVEGFVHPEGAASQQSWMEPLRQRWAAAVNGRQLPWYLEEKRHQGAFATFLGLAFAREDEAAGRWKALAVGDSCLFQVRKDHLVHAFPLERAEAFGNLPELVSSRPGSHAGVARQKVESGGWKPGDRFLLMTDAIAEWFLRCAALKPWQLLAQRFVQPDPDAALAAFIEKLRDRDEMRNDDVTLVIVDPLE